MILHKQKYGPKESLKFLITIPDNFKVEYKNISVTKKSITVFDPCNDFFLSKHFLSSKIFQAELNGEFSGRIVASTDDEKSTHEIINLLTLLTQQFLNQIKVHYGINGHMFPFLSKHSSSFHNFSTHYSAIAVTYSLHIDDTTKEIKYFIISN